MEEDRKKIIKLLLNYLKIIVSEYKDCSNISEELFNEDIVRFNSSDTISFFVKDGVLYLPKQIYNLMGILIKDPLYGSCYGDRRNVEDYLDTNTTYHDYINHFIKAGLTPYEYFEESLLHEAMHMCGSGGGNPLEEGINELKTRELAQKNNIKIAAYGYPKEVEIAKRLQEILGKDIMDQLTFIKTEDRKNFLIENVGAEKANLYERIYKDMIRLSNEYNESIHHISSPYDKALAYDKIDYSTILEYIEEYKNQDRYMA